jgi:hypothetical protein
MRGSRSLAGIMSITGLCLSHSAVADWDPPTANAVCVVPTPGCSHNHAETHKSWRLTWSNRGLQCDAVIISTTADECCEGAYEQGGAFACESCDSP